MRMIWIALVICGAAALLYVACRSAKKQQGRSLPMVYINLMDPKYGAEADGVHDDTEAFWKAINDCPPMRNCTLKLAESHYKITVPLREIMYHVGIEGAGRGATFIRWVSPEEAKTP